MGHLLCLDVEIISTYSICCFFFVIFPLVKKNNIYFRHFFNIILNNKWIEIGL